ncbi:MAG: SpoIIE family protein phosphatase [Bacteroidales bacterium]
MVIEKGGKILLVEDSFESLENVTTILTDAGYDTVTSFNGNNAFKHIIKDKFDLIILDHKESIFSGYEVFAQLKENGHNVNVPIVFVTSGDAGKNVLEGIRFPNVDFIRKPFYREELLTRVSNQLELLRRKEESNATRNLTDSINYALRIQKSMMPSQEMMGSVFPKHFMLDKPLNVVSGDFYWVKKIDNLIVLAVADCTGHGVPGAFLSVLGISILNELSMKMRLDYPNIMLDNMRRKFKESLVRSGLESYTSEGIDMVITMIDTNSMKLYSAGAFNSLYHVRNGKINEIKGDRQPVGYYPVEKPFTPNSIQLQQGDRLYFSTDGMLDQMGGEKGKKLKSRGFKEWLKQMNDLSPEEHREFFINRMNQWMAHDAQIDDILVMGIEI